MTTAVPPLVRPRPPWATPAAGAAPARGPRVLVVVASRHGATREIGAALTRSLPRTPAGRAGRLTAVVVPVQRRPDPIWFDAVVLGSAIYDERWLLAAVWYAEYFAGDLRVRPTWLFSSGLSGTSPVDDAFRVGDLVGARGHRMLPGRLDPRLVSAGESSPWAATPSVPGDRGNWPAIDGWAEEIAEDLAVRARPR